MPFFSFCDQLDEEETTTCFTLIAFLMSCDLKCVRALPHCFMGWSAVSECGTVFPDHTHSLFQIKKIMT